MHWTYKQNAGASLEQGDILKPTEYLVEQVLKRYHPYYATHSQNQFYIVITQSCDLELRSGKCKSPHITLVPVRPLRSIIEREFGKYLQPTSSGDLPYGSNSDRSRLKQFLIKLFNNNDSKYFFLEKQPECGLAEDMCAILSLSISIKAEHYNECVNARILQLADTFQAKLGWLIGQMYSRVGTLDWAESEASAKAETHVNQLATWYKEDAFKAINQKVKEQKKSNPSYEIDQTAVLSIANSIPAKKDLAIDSIFKVLEKTNTLPSDNKTKTVIRNTLKSDPAFSQFFKAN